MFFILCGNFDIVRDLSHVTVNIPKRKNKMLKFMNYSNSEGKLVGKFGRKFVDDLAIHQQDDTDDDYEMMLIFIH